MLLRVNVPFAFISSFPQIPQDAVNAADHILQYVGQDCLLSHVNISRFTQITQDNTPFLAVGATGLFVTRVNISGTLLLPRPTKTEQTIICSMCSRTVCDLASSCHRPVFAQLPQHGTFSSAWTRTVCYFTSKCH